MTETTPSIDPSPTREAGRIVNALSFDIEDWFHLVEIESVSDTDRWPGFPTIVERVRRMQAEAVHTAASSREMQM